MYYEYMTTIVRGINKIYSEEQTVLEQAASFTGKTLAEDGLIYLFGCGHSHMLAEEGFYRAGGLGAVCPILATEVMLHEGAVKSSRLERRADLAEDILNRYPISKKDTLIVFSTSGINGMAIEMARLARKSGAAVIGISSGAYSEDKSRHPEGLRLRDVCDVWIDNGAPHGDASYPIMGTEGNMAPVSTIFGSYILNCILARGAEICVSKGVIPKIYVSGNVEGGFEKNMALIQQYRGKIRSL